MLIDNIAKYLGYSGGREFSPDHFFPYIDHIAPSVMLLADCSVMSVLRMPGVPFSLIMNSQRNGYKRRLTAFLNAVADDNVECHIHLVKHDATLPPANHTPAIAPYAQMVLADYHASIDEDLSVIDWFLTIRVKPRTLPFAGITDKVVEIGQMVGLLAKRNVTDPQLEVQLDDAVRLALGTLKPFGPVVLGIRPETTAEGETLEFSEIAEFLYLLRTVQFSPQPMTDVFGFLGAGIAAVDVTTEPKTRMLRIDHAAGGSPATQTFVSMLGLVTYPKLLDQSRLDELLAIKGRFVMTVAMRFETRAEVQDALDLLYRRLVSSNNKAVEDTEDLVDAISAVAGGRAESGISRWSLALHGGTKPEVDRLVSAARNIIANAAAKITPEGTGQLASNQAQLPGAPASTWIRPARCTTKQITVLATLSGHARGPAKPRWGKHLFRMLSTAGTAYDHDLFVDDVGHNYLGAPNGAGKTVWLAMNIIALDAAVRASGGTQIIFDIDESNHNTVLMVGGRYSTIQIGYSGVAPLRGLGDSPRVRQLIRDLIAGLVQTEGGLPPTKVERDGIRAGVDFIMGELPPDQRDFATIRSYMGFDDNGAGDRLEPWCRGNELGWVFDGESHDVDFNTRLVGVDLTAVMTDARIMPPLAMMLLWMASSIMDGRRVVIWCEEAPAYMPTPAFAKPFKGIALRARKRNASFNAISQQPSDMLNNEAGHALVKQARQMILFRNDKPVEADYRDGLGLTPAEYRVISEDMFALPYHTVLIKRQDGQSGLNRFDLSSMPQHLNIMSGTPKRVKLLQDCLQHSNGDEMTAFAEFQSRIHETAA